jgi:integrase
LDLLRSRHPNQPSNSFVFPAPHSLSKPIDIRSAWGNALEKANISNFRFHELRHTAASHFAMNQASLLEIGTLLGHKTVQMTKRYAYLSNTDIYSTARTLNDKIYVNKLFEKPLRLGEHLQYSLNLNILKSNGIKLFN